MQDPPILPNPQTKAVAGWMHVLGLEVNMGILRYLIRTANNAGEAPIDFLFISISVYSLYVNLKAILEDSVSYIPEAAAVHHWQFEYIQQPKHKPQVGPTRRRPEPITAPTRRFSISKTPF
jgi:hypothetical protein